MGKHVVTNIVGGTSRYDLAKVGLGYTLNMYEETVNSNENYVSKVLRPIKGYRKVCDIPGECRGMFTCSNGYDGKPVTYAVFDNQLYLIVNSTRTPFLIATLAQGNAPVHFAETGNREGFHSHIVIVDGNYCYAVDTQIRPANQADDFRIIQLPYTNVEQGTTIKPTHVAYLYGYLVVSSGNTDSFYLSYQFPFERNTEDDTLDYNIFQVGSEEWGDGGQSIQAYWSSDNTVALVANGSRLYTFGPRSYQMFQYTGDLNVPFNSPDTAAFPIGIKAVNSLCQIGSTVIWLGASDLGNNGVYVIQGSNMAKRVSTPEIEREIAAMSFVTDAKAQVWQDSQHVFYCISFPTEGVTYCYDLTEDSWSNRCSLDSANNKTTWRYNFATMDYGGRILQAFTGGIAEQVDSNWLEHDNTPILRLRRGGIIQSNYSRFYLDCIELMTNNGQYSYIPGVQAKVMMRFSPDGGNWSDLETVDVGYVGDYDYDCAFYDFGLAKCFTLELSCSDNVPFALYGIKIQADECSF